MLRQRQNNAGWMMDFGAMHSGQGDLMLAFCTGTMPVGKACLVLSKNQCNVRCGKDEGCVKGALPDLVEVYLREVFSSEIDLSVNEDIRYAAQLFLAKTDGIQA